MAFIGTIAVGLVASTTELKSGLARGITYVKDFAVRMGMAEGTAARYAATVRSAAVPVAAVAGALGILGGKAAKANLELAEMTKLAERLGTTQAKLAGLQEAAASVGLSPEDTSNALLQLTRHLSKARYEGGDAARTIQALGLDVERLGRMDAASAFVAVASQIRLLPDDYAKAKAAEELFGRTGIQMMALLKLSTLDYQTALRKAYDYGAARSPLETAAAKKLADAWRAMKNEVKGTWTELGTLIGPALEKVMRAVNWLLKNFSLSRHFDAILSGLAAVQVGVARFAELALKGMALMLDAAAKLPSWLGGGVAADASAYVHSLARTVADWGAAAGEEMRARMRDLNLGRTPEGGAYSGPGDVGPVRATDLFGGAAGKRPHALESVALTRLASGLPGISGRQEVSDKRAHEILQAIERRLWGPAPAYAGR